MFKFGSCSVMAFYSLFVSYSLMYIHLWNGNPVQTICCMRLVKKQPRVAQRWIQRGQRGRYHHRNDAQGVRFGACSLEHCKALGPLSASVNDVYIYISVYIRIIFCYISVYIRIIFCYIYIYPSIYALFFVIYISIAYSYFYVIYLLKLISIDRQTDREIDRYGSKYVLNNLYVYIYILFDLLYLLIDLCLKHI